jgi:signal recognition particle subunit SRP54
MFDFLSEKFSTIFSRITGQAHLNEHNINEALGKVEESLLEADVPYAVVKTFIEEIKQEAIGKKVLSSLKPGDQLIKIVHEKLKVFLGSQQAAGDFSFQIPSVAMVMGLQGSGKTTSIAKLAHYTQKQAKKRGKTRRILVASVDFYRPAAIDQLEILARQVGVDFYRAQNTNPCRAAEEIYAYYKQHGYELLLLDTAGRLHVDSEMLEELRAIDAKLQPKYKILVLDAMTGQESLTVAQAFDQAIGFHWSVLSKMDSEARGGSAFAFRYVLKKPVLFTGVGEKIDDLEQFHPDRMAGRILGMGDVLSLLERAEERVNLEDQESLVKSISRGSMTLQDFADQISMVNKIGSLGSVVKYMPGVGGQLSPQAIEQGERQLKQFKAIISSMTMKERLNPRILNGERKKRIAGGAGVTLSDINILLERFEQSQQYVKLFKKMNKFGNFFK